MFAESRCWTEELLFVLIGIARMVDSATKHLVSRVRQSLDVHKNKRIRQKMERIRGEHMKTIWKRTVQSMISGEMLTWTVFEEFGKHDKHLTLPGWWWALPSTAWWGIVQKVLHCIDTGSISGYMLILGVLHRIEVICNRLTIKTVVWHSKFCWIFGRMARESLQNDEWFVLFCASFTARMVVGATKHRVVRQPYSACI